MSRSGICIVGCMGALVVYSIFLFFGDFPMEALAFFMTIPHFFNVYMRFAVPAQ